MLQVNGIRHDFDTVAFESRLAYQLRTRKAANGNYHVCLLNAEHPDRRFSLPSFNTVCFEQNGYSRETLQYRSDRQEIEMATEDKMWAQLPRMVCRGERVANRVT